MRQVHVGDQRDLRFRWFDENFGAKDITGYTTLTISIQREGGSTVVRNASVETNTTNIAIYKTTAADLTVPGVYRAWCTYINTNTLESVTAPEVLRFAVVQNAL